MKKVVYLLILCFTILVGCETIDLIPNTKYAFSVSEKEKIVFAPGNLQYVVSEDKWQFAEDQYAFIGNRNFSDFTKIDGYSGLFSKTGVLGDTIDMFAWGTGNKPTELSNEYSEYENFEDWGENKIGIYNEGVWRTITQEEWRYVIAERKDAILLCGIAQVCGVNGLLLLPDNWECPKGVVFFPGYYGWDGSKYYAEHQSFDEKQWKVLEKSGAVFLPAVGRRIKTVDYSPIGQEYYCIEGIQYSGEYWTSTIRDDDQRYAVILCFGSNLILYNNPAIYKASGLPVRLVRSLY